ncbi:hypothetical protein C0J52_09678 [Blattella germanica]|nr:hypothetical protein C0J52_09678 [Blattella germanica]
MKKIQRPPFSTLDIPSHHNLSRSTNLIQNVGAAVGGGSVDSYSLKNCESALFNPEGNGSVQIKDLRVPPTVKNGSRYALLDCEYTLKPDELNADAYSGLVVKWYFNNSPSPVYQWIPGQKPQDLGVLRGKLDLSHRASDHGATMHRALYIPNPTTELSGDYKCLVSTFSDEDFMTKKMVVYGE